MKRLKILFVEDLPTDVEIAQRVLNDHGIGFDARVVDTEPAYREALDAFQPDVIISDYAMPTFDGMRALEIALAHPVAFPFVVLTGSMNEETAVACMKAGANDYVIKEKIRRLPFAVLEAIEKIKITAQKEQAEAEVRRSLAQLRALREIESALSSTLQLDEVLEIILEAISRVIACDSFSVQILEGEALEIIACRGFKHPEKVVGLTYPLTQKFPNYRVIKGAKPLAFTDIVQEYPHFQENADKYSSFGVRSWLGTPLVAQSKAIGMIAFDRETVRPFSADEIELADMFSAQAAMAIHNAELYERTRRQLMQLEVLRRIDALITSDLVLAEALPELLRAIQSSLAVDAAAIFLFDEETKDLALEATIGLHTKPRIENRIPLGQGNSGKVAETREGVSIPEVTYLDDESNFPFSWAQEKIVSFFAFPMIAKGQLEGVLDLFNRSRLDPDAAWKDFAETLSRQAAITVNNLTLFNDLETANQELRSAYDKTIEGWAKALELRDQETEGHSERVIDLGLRLARKFGFDEEELAHLRRGFLLHDIGKMGIPDAILRKPGPLTKEEWAVMRQHPQFAYDMLAPVNFLHPALDIPLYHHEKWDGSGYPEGLEGDEIPLAARIFAIVDVWDALCSDRPYRKAWPEEKTLAYLRDQSGRHFDPDVVDAFFEVIPKSSDVKKRLYGS